jgi:hypothetical protein
MTPAGFCVIHEVREPPQRMAPSLCLQVAVPKLRLPIPKLEVVVSKIEVAIPTLGRFWDQFDPYFTQLTVHG